MRVIVVIKDEAGDIDVEVYGSLTALNKERPELSPSTVQKNIVNNGSYSKGDLKIFRRDVVKKKRLDNR